MFRSLLLVTATLLAARGSIREARMAVPDSLAATPEESFGKAGWGRSGSFTLTVDLAGPDDVGFYNLRGNAYASAVSAVPEPGTWAMMLLGLASVGAAARRKRAC